MTSADHATAIPPAPALPFEMRADLGEYRRRLGVARVVLAVALTFLIWLRVGWLGWAISVGIIVTVLAITFTLLSRRVLTVTEQGILRKNAWSRERLLPWHEVGEILVFANYLQQGFGTAPRVIIADHKGVAFASLLDLYWRVDDLNLLVAAVEERSGPATAYADVASSAAITKSYPRLLPLYERRPMLAGLALAGIILIAIVIFVLVAL